MDIYCSPFLFLLYYRLLFAALFIFYFCIVSFRQRRNARRYLNIYFYSFQLIDPCCPRSLPPKCPHFIYHSSTFISSWNASPLDTINRSTHCSKFLHRFPIPILLTFPYPFQPPSHFFVAPPSLRDNDILEEAFVLTHPWSRGMIFPMTRGYLLDRSMISTRNRVRNEAFAARNADLSHAANYSDSSALCRRVDKQAHL